MLDRDQFGEGVVERDLGRGGQAGQDTSTNQGVDALRRCANGTAGRGQQGGNDEEPAAAENVRETSDEGVSNGETERPRKDDPVVVGAWAWSSTSAWMSHGTTGARTKRTDISIDQGNGSGRHDESAIGSQSTGAGSDISAPEVHLTVWRLVGDVQDILDLGGGVGVDGLQLIATEPGVVVRAELAAHRDFTTRKVG